MVEISSQGNNVILNVLLNTRLVSKGYSALYFTLHNARNRWFPATVYGHFPYMILQVGLLTNQICSIFFLVRLPVLFSFEVAQDVVIILLHESEWCTNVVVLQDSSVIVQHCYFRSINKENVSFIHIMINQITICSYMFC